jgi:hypothetical protein
VLKKNQNLKEVYGKKGRQNNGDKKWPKTYPLSGSGLFTIQPEGGMYCGGDIRLPYGVRLFLHPPDEVPWGEPVEINVKMDKHPLRNELIFEFEPHGCTFYPPAEISLSWGALGVNKFKLYYIDENGTYLEQHPVYLDYFTRELKLRMTHFSRYAIGEWLEG